MRWIRSGPNAGRVAAALGWSALALAGCQAAEAQPPVRAVSDLEFIILGGPDGRADLACFRCHGLEGGGDAAGAPRLAGLPAGYMEKQFLGYARELRPDKIMSPISRMLSETERRELARWYAALPPVTANPPSPPSPRGEQLYWRGDPGTGRLPCAGCHGAPWEGRGPGFPPLAGQPAPYIVRQLEHWRQGVRRNDPMGMMVEQARRMTGEEMKAVAGYLAATPPGGPSSPARTAADPVPFAAPPTAPSG